MDNYIYLHTFFIYHALCQAINHMLIAFQFLMNITYKFSQVHIHEFSLLLIQNSYLNYL